MSEKIETSDTEEQQIDSIENQRRLGAVGLTLANFQDRHKEIIDSSFNKARENGEKLPGKNNERRNYAYLSRLENLIDKYGNKAEKKLWEASIKDNLLIEYDDIPETYWQSKRQEHRDNGYGNIELTEAYKHELFNKERELQKESLEKWANYLGDEHSPYPLWFKVYAWDGMTKMGKYDKSKGKYATRNKTTIAPYPDPDAEVLGGIFEVINCYYGNNEREFYTEEGERNIELEKVVQSGNFAKIYNAIEHDIAPIIEPPENPEDVHGEWVEYGIGEEDDIARAAKGTGWCVASPSVGKHYLEYGTYGQDEDRDEDYGEDHSDYNESKFILFHLEDPSTRKLSKNAVASIRLDPDGQVAEISGLKEGQALNDSLVPVVAEKVKSLPGGEKFLEAFADKQELIRLDHKMQNNEDLTKEELEFIYEINHPIHTLDTYNNSDPRINELREKYGLEYALNAGVDINQLVSELDSDDIVNNLDTFISHGADINQLVSKLYQLQIAENLDTLISHGANININQLVSKLKPLEIAENLDTLINHGANIKIDQLVSKLDSYQIANNLDALISHGANIDINQLVSKLGLSILGPYYIANNLDALISHGADINQLVSKLNSPQIAENLDTLISHGANINQLVSKLYQLQIADNLDTLISHGADINQLVSELDSDDIVKNLDTLISHGADINQLVSKLYQLQIADNLDALISHGANIDINQLVSELDSDDIVKNLDTLINHGAKINQLVSKFNSLEIAENLDTLISHGANININQLVPKLESYQIANNLDTLINHGANIDINQLVSELGSDILGPVYIINNLDTLISHGADINQLVSKLESDDIARNLDILRRHGYTGN